MNIRTVFIRAAIATAMCGFTLAFAEAPNAAPAQEGVTMSVDARAPLHAVLLPTLDVIAGVERSEAQALARIAAATSLPVTLLPTVHVNARWSAFAMAVTPRHERVAIAAHAFATDAAHEGSGIEESGRGVAKPAMRAAVLPR